MASVDVICHEHGKTIYSFAKGSAVCQGKWVYYIIVNENVVYLDKRVYSVAWQNSLQFDKMTCNVSS